MRSRFTLGCNQVSVPWRVVKEAGGGGAGAYGALDERIHDSAGLTLALQKVRCVVVALHCS